MGKGGRADELTELVGDHEVFIYTAGRLENRESPASAFRRDNISTTEALIAASLATGRSKIIHFSSVSVHGVIDAKTVDEDTPSREPTAYGASKRLPERALARACAKNVSVSFPLPRIISPFAHENWLARCQKGCGQEASCQSPIPTFFQ
jgi:nucleoside-diphosphate-sugar epimerase